MPSSALNEWRSSRRQRVDELYAAHAVVGGQAPGRRRATEQLNWAIALRLAGEFQGFVRDLHDEATDYFVSSSCAPTPAFASALQILLSVRRDIDNKNATRSTLSQDFRRFGFPILDEIKSYRRGEDWLLRLDELNKARNAVAHDNRAEMAVAADGPSLRLDRVRRWDRAVNSLAEACDAITSAKLAAITGGSKPW